MPSPENQQQEVNGWFGAAPFLQEATTENKEPMDVNNARLDKIFKYNRVNPIPSSRINEGLKQFVEALEISGVKIPCGKPGHVSRNAETLVGVEIEIENTVGSPMCQMLQGVEVVTTANNCFNRVWTATTDDSLRNHGTEFITLPGLQAGDLPAALRILELYLRGYYGKAETNYRCGTHVHIDVRSFTVAQYTAFVMLYTIFENLFYQASGNRRKNIFCVPIRDSGSTLEPLFYLVLHKQRPTYPEFRSIFGHFKKYMAFNLLTTGAQNPSTGKAPIGTVEFRHHRGTSNPTELSNWVQLILDVHRGAQILSLSEIKDLVFGLNSKANYLEFAAKVFGTAPSMPGYSRQDLIDDMYEGSAFLKEVYLNAKGLA